MDYGYRYLGKKTVLCKDTPAFIANRVGVYAIMSLFHTVKEMDLTIEEVDKLTGPVLGRPKSATFRTCDVVGLDTLVHVANGLKDNCANDEEKALFELPDFVSKMVENNWLGSKSKQGFYKKTKNTEGKREILSLDLNTLEYRAKKKANFPTLSLTKNVDSLYERTKMLLNASGKEGTFYKKVFGGIFAYVANRLPEISDDLYKIDDALKAGFGWELGPFETWSIIGIEKGIQMIESEGKQVAPWIREMVDAGIDKFYDSKEGKKTYYDVSLKAHVPVPNLDAVVSLQSFRAQNTVWSNSDCHLMDIGDGILNLEFHSKMNTIGAGIIEGINKGIDLAEKEYKGLVIANEGQHFSAGANVATIFMYAVEQEYDELDFAIRQFQNTMMRIRYSSIPVVAAPHNMALGGGCEINLHADKVVAHAELYMGLVEFGVGLIPGGGGTKEFAKRLSDELYDGDIKINRLRERFLTIGQAKVSTSAYEAFDLGLLIEGRDEIVMNRELLLSRAKEACIELADAGYTQPVREKNVTVVGQEGLGIVYVGANSMQSGEYISEHDQFISEKLGFVLCGGDLSENTVVTEQYLLDLERKTFLELCVEGVPSLSIINKINPIDMVTPCSDAL